VIAALSVAELVKSFDVSSLFMFSVAELVKSFEILLIAESLDVFRYG
jgi:hypothetical protein